MNLFSYNTDVGRILAVALIVGGAVSVTALITSHLEDKQAIAAGHIPEIPGHD